MAADLHIHIADSSIEEDVRVFQKRAFWSSINGNCDKNGNPISYDEGKVSNSPNVWIGEVSWLKASLLKDEKTFIPSTVMQVSKIVGNKLPVIDDKFIKKILDAFKLPNNTQYRLAKRTEVKKFLEEHKGKKAYQISW